MQLFEGYTADELHGVLTASRWIAGLLILLGVIAVAFNQWLTHRISVLQKAERVETSQRLVERETELRRLRVQAKEVVTTFDKLTTSRKLTASQIETFKGVLKKESGGKIIVTYLTVEWDAEDFARQIADILRGAGLDITFSDHLWVQFDHNGVFITSPDKELPAAAKNLQAAFAAIDMAVPAVPPGGIPKELGAAEGDTILAVGNRE